MYGATPVGGALGFGAIYRVMADGQLEVLAHFTGASGSLPGSNAASGLTLAGDGNLYGVTVAGGAEGTGTVFKVVPGGPVTSLASFTGLIGSLPGFKPVGSLAVGADGNLYGTTREGGAAQAGSFPSPAGNSAQDDGFFERCRAAWGVIQSPNSTAIAMRTSAADKNSDTEIQGKQCGSEKKTHSDSCNRVLDHKLTLQHVEHGKEATSCGNRNHYGPYHVVLACPIDEPKPDRRKAEEQPKRLFHGVGNPE